MIRDLTTPGTPSPSVKAITDEVLRRDTGGHQRLTPRAVGYLIRKKLGLATHRTGGVYVLAPEAYPRLDELYDRYGIAAAADRRVQSLFELPEVPEVLADESAL